MVRLCPVDDEPRVHLGALVRLRDAAGLEELRVVAPDDADAAAGRVSAESPMGRALLGRAVGERVEVRTPGGVRAVQVVGVEPAGAAGEGWSR